jgi:methionyl-tRNA synthetase
MPANPSPTGGSPYYVTTPIYYVNDRPHIGHCYTTVLADVAARFQRLFGKRVFFLTGTDEHADKVVTSAKEHGVGNEVWVDKNAAEFAKAFGQMNCSNDDFIRTTQPRHKEKVHAYIRALQERGAVYKGDYTGWYDPGQEEYVTETAAKEQNFVSSVSGKPLVKRTERNYFFRLSAFEQKLAAHVAANPEFIMPDARRNEVLGRLRDGLQDVPVSRAVTDDPATQWGIRMPDDPGHRVYVWIDALFNYLSCVDTPERRPFWPPPVHFIGKEILWFHAVIWPAMLMALGETLPRTVYAHAYWVRDGRKMSKSLGNFIDIDLLNAYCTRYSRDAVRYYLVTQGPHEATDADFSHGKFVEVYNADLANGLGNATSRVGNMIAKYFEGRCPDPAGSTGEAGHDWPSIIATHVQAAIAKADRFDLPGALREGVALSARVDGYVNATEPFKMAKKIDGDPALRVKLGQVLYHCAEALRVATLILSPAIPEAAARVLDNWSCAPIDLGAGHALAHAAAWGGHHSLQPGQAIRKGEPLFMRVDPAEAAPGAAVSAPAAG